MSGVIKLSRDENSTVTEVRAWSSITEFRRQDHGAVFQSYEDKSKEQCYPAKDRKAWNGVMEQRRE